nr:zf-CCHC domain-containing protein/UBN2 domain-containing protein [Tanacetum cinerariifolium]
MFYIIYVERVTRNRTFANDVTAKITTKDDVTSIVCLDVEMMESFPKACNLDFVNYSKLRECHEKFFKRRGRFVRQPWNDKNTSQRSRDDKNGKSDRKCFRYGDPNHLIGEYPNPPRDKNQRAFVGGSWSDSGEEDDEKVKD